MRGLGWPILCHIQQDRSTTLKNLPFKSWRHILIAQEAGCEPPLHPPAQIRRVTFLSISQFPWIIEPRYLRLSLLGMACGYNVSLPSHVTRLAPQILCFSPAKLETFKLKDLPSA